MTDWKEINGFLYLQVPDPFDFKVNLAYLQRDINECMYEVENNQITRLIEVSDEAFLIRISEADKTTLKIAFLGERKPRLKEEYQDVADYISEWFDFGIDLSGFYALAEQDELLKRAIRKSSGLRIIGIHDLFEALCWGIIGQQINLAFAYTLKRRFVEGFGKSVTYQEKKYWLFPDYRRVAELAIEDLRALKMTQRKSEYIIGVAKLIAAGKLSKEQLLTLGSLQAAEKELVKIRGIGPWTANYVSMRCLRYPDSFPIADVGLMNALKGLLQLDRKPTKEEILALAAPWKNWEAYATFYLWRTLY